MRIFGPTLGHSRNGYVRFSQIHTFWSNLKKESRNGDDRLSQICNVFVLCWGILGMGMLGCPTYANFRFNFRVF